MRRAPCEISDRAAATARTQRGFELWQLVGHRGPDVNLWIRWRFLPLLGGLALSDELLCLFERFDERILEAQRMLEQRVAEIGRGASAAATRGGAIGRGGGDGERVLGLERIDESA